METVSIKILSYLVVFLIGGWLGYILKDKLTDEYEVNTTIHKAKIKGDGSTLDLTQNTKTEIKKKTKPGWIDRIKQRIKNIRKK